MNILDPNMAGALEVLRGRHKTKRRPSIMDIVPVWTPPTDEKVGGANAEAGGGSDRNSDSNSDSDSDSDSDSNSDSGGNDDDADGGGKGRPAARGGSAAAVAAAAAERAEEDRTAVFTGNFVRIQLSEVLVRLRETMGEHFRERFVEQVERFYFVCRKYGMVPRYDQKTRERENERTRERENERIRDERTSESENVKV